MTDQGRIELVIPDGIDPKSAHKYAQDHAREAGLLIYDHDLRRFVEPNDKFPSEIIFGKRSATTGEPICRVAYMQAR